MFDLNEKEEKAYIKFAEKKTKKWKKGKIGRAPRFSFLFSPTGIGNNITIICSDGDEKDITDYESW